MKNKIMDLLSEKEKKIIEKLKRNNTNIPNLIKRMKISIWICFGLWIFIPIFSFFAFSNEGPPKIYHLLAIVSIIFLSIAIYTHCKNVLRIIKNNENI
jgi:hypothetical protein